MSINSSSFRDPTIYMTTVPLSLPPLISSHMCVLSLSCEHVRKYLEKNHVNERQSPVLAKGEVVLRKEMHNLFPQSLSCPSENRLTLYSHNSCVSNDEIITKEHRDLGFVTCSISGSHSDKEEEPLTITGGDVVLDDQTVANADASSSSESDSFTMEKDPTLSPYRKVDVDSELKVASPQKKFDFNTPPDYAELNRQSQWEHEWSQPNAEVRFAQAHTHLSHTVSHDLKDNPELQAHMKTTGLLFKGFHSEIEKIPQRISTLSEEIGGLRAGMATKADLRLVKEAQLKVVERLDRLESKFDQILTLLLNDAKKGEIVNAVAQTCSSTPDVTKKNTDDPEDEGANPVRGKSVQIPIPVAAVAGSSRPIQAGESGSGSGSGSASGAGGSGGSTQQQQIIRDPSLMLDSPSVAKKFTQVVDVDGRQERVYYKHPLIQQIDDEAAKNLLLEINEGEDLQELLQAEQAELELIKAKAEKEKEKEKKKEEMKARKGQGRGRGRGGLPPRPVSRPKEKGIKIGEPAAVQTNVKSPVAQQGEPNADRKDKGKMIDEPKKVTVPKPQASTQTAQVNPDTSTQQVKTDVAVPANPDGGAVAVSKVKPGLTPGSLLLNTFVSKPVMRSSDELKGSDTGFKSAMAEMVALEKPRQAPHKTHGLGSRDLAKENVKLKLDNEANRLHKLDEELTQAHLDKLIAVSLVLDTFDGKEPKEKMLYFLEDGKVLILSEEELLVRHKRELLHVLHLFRVKDDICAKWQKKIKTAVNRLKGSMWVNESENPRYYSFAGKEVEMLKNTAEFDTIMGKRVLTFNPESTAGCVVQVEDMEKSTIPELRAAIYQIGDATVEHKVVKAQMEMMLEIKEERLVTKFLNSAFSYKRI